MQARRGSRALHVFGNAAGTALTEHLSCSDVGTLLESIASLPRATRYSHPRAGRDPRHEASFMERLARARELIFEVDASSYPWRESSPTAAHSDERAWTDCRTFLAVVPAASARRGTRHSEPNLFGIRAGTGAESKLVVYFFRCCCYWVFFYCSSLFFSTIMGGFLPFFLSSFLSSFPVCLSCVLALSLFFCFKKF